MDGGSLTVTEPSESNGRFEIFGGSTLTANGREAHFSGRGPTRLAGGSLIASNGGLVDLSNVAQISDSAGNSARQADVLSDGVNSEVDLSALVNFAQQSTFDASWQSSITATNFGIVRLNSTQTVLTNVTTSTSNNGIIIGEFALRGLPDAAGPREPTSLLTPEMLANFATVGKQVFSDQAGGPAPDIEFRITNLPDNYLGYAAPEVIWIDVDAAGYGWFIDETPWDDEEFDAAGLAHESSPARRRYDLLSVVLHELAHAAGARHEDGLEELLEVGQRQALSSRVVDYLFGGSD